jgi:hypothetical protein
MKTLAVEADIAPDGTLHLAVPSGLPPGKVEVVLVIQPKQQNGASLLQERSPTYYDATQRVKDNGSIQFAHEDKPFDPSSLMERERLTRIKQLLDLALIDVEWAEIEEGRQDRDFGD